MCRYTHDTYKHACTLLYAKKILHDVFQTVNCGFPEEWLWEREIDNLIFHFKLIYSVFFLSF